VTLLLTPWCGFLLATNEQYSIIQSWRVLFDRSSDTNRPRGEPYSPTCSLGSKSGSGVKENELKKRCNDFGGTANPQSKVPIITPLLYAIRKKFGSPSNENESYI
jgi:hypothetical protein